MKMQPKMIVMGVLAAIVALGILGQAALAGVHVSVNYGSGYRPVPVYTAPVYAPRVIYSQPVYAPRVYVQPQPVYVQPQPVYVQPQPVYYYPPVYAPPVVYYRPVPVYYVQPRPWYNSGGLSFSWNSGGGYGGHNRHGGHRR